MVRKRLSKELRKGQIAGIAAGLFASRGFSGVTTREIAKKAGINESILFRHFPTKVHLYNAIIDQKVHLRPEHFDLSAARSGNDREVFCSVANHLLEQVEKDNTFLRLMLYSALEGHELSSLFIRNRTNVLFDFIHDYIDERKRAGAFRSVDSKVATRAFIGMVFNFIMVRELFKVPASMRVSTEEAVNGFVDLYLNGIRKR